MTAKSKTRNKNILLYADSETNSNALYATGFFCPDAFVFIRTARGRRILVMSDLEMDRARQQSQVDRVLSWSRIAASLEKAGLPRLSLYYMR